MIAPKDYQDSGERIGQAFVRDAIAHVAPTLPNTLDDRQLLTEHACAVTQMMLLGLLDEGGDPAARFAGVGMAIGIALGQKSDLAFASCVEAMLGGLKSGSANARALFAPRGQA